jgi:hypothetical protein
MSFAAAHFPPEAEYRDPNCYSVVELHSFYIVEFLFASCDTIGVKYVPNLNEALTFLSKCRIPKRRQHGELSLLADQEILRLKYRAYMIRPLDGILS